MTSDEEREVDRELCRIEILVFGMPYSGTIASRLVRVGDTLDSSLDRLKRIEDGVAKIHRLRMKSTRR